MDQGALPSPSIDAYRGALERDAAFISSRAVIFSPCAANPNFRHPADILGLPQLHRLDFFPEAPWFFLISSTTSTWFARIFARHTSRMGSL